MALPGHRRNPSHRRERAIHYQLRKKTLMACSNCAGAVLPHHACPHCGQYAGRQVVKK